MKLERTLTNTSQNTDVTDCQEKFDIVRSETPIRSEHGKAYLQFHTQMYTIIVSCICVLKINKAREHNPTHLLQKKQNEE